MESSADSGPDECHRCGRALHDDSGRNAEDANAEPSHANESPEPSFGRSGLLAHVARMKGEPRKKRRDGATSE